MPPLLQTGSAGPRERTRMGIAKTHLEGLYEKIAFRVECVSNVFRNDAAESLFLHCSFSLAELYKYSGPLGRS